MPEVWFIRHGESIANVGGATRTAEEAELTAVGHEQAQHIAAHVQREARGKLVKIIASSYKRAQQTAQYTKTLLNKSHIDTTWPVGEFNYLALPTNTFTTSTDRLPLVKSFWETCSPFLQYRDKAESFALFMKRAHSTIESLCTCEDEQLILVFSHQQFIQAIRWLLERGRDAGARDPQLLEIEMRRFRSLLSTDPMPNGAILKTQLNLEIQQVVSGFEDSHLPSKLPRTTVVPHIEANLPAEPLPLSAGC